MSNKESELQIKRHKQLEQKLLGNGGEDDPNLPLEQLRDGPVKFKKLK